ncbi:hypothetical protein C8J57DRAFT_1714832 [Mycena rebaudengoi]|nr:hypothetical protein C8J57DRAFT_1714832 [Mycena rebaudengoi]
MAALLLEHGAEVGACKTHAIWATTGLEKRAPSGLLGRRSGDGALSRRANRTQGHYGGALGFGTLWAGRPREVPLGQGRGCHRGRTTISICADVRRPSAPGGTPVCSDGAAGTQLQAKARKVMICRETETIAEADWATARDGQKDIMALLLAHGASKDATMARFSHHLKALADEVE